MTRRARSLLGGVAAHFVASWIFVITTYPRNGSLPSGLGDTLSLFVAVLLLAPFFFGGIAYVSLPFAVYGLITGHPNLIADRIVRGYFIPFAICSALVQPLLLIQPLLRRRERLRARRIAAGLCTVCGYDLRASKERCPECGTQVPAQTIDGGAWRGG